MLFKAGDRIILSYPTVKRLSISLVQLIRRYEEQFGQIQIQPANPRPSPRRNLRRGASAGQPPAAPRRPQ